MRRTTTSGRCLNHGCALRLCEPMSWARSANPAIFWRSTATCRYQRSGDLLAIMSAGAYGAVQAGTYNTRPLVPEVMVKGDQWSVIRPRLEADALIALDRLPPWL